MLLCDGVVGPDAAAAVRFLIRLAGINPTYRRCLAGVVERLVSPDVDTPGTSARVRAAAVGQLAPVIEWAADGDATVRMYAYLMLGQCRGPVVLLRQRWAVETDPEQTPTEEPVAVYVVDEGRDGQLFRRYQSYLKNPTGTPPGFPAAPELVLRFPERSWALPDDPEYPRLVEMVHQIEAGADVVVVAVVSEPSRRALGGVRAGLLAARVTEQQALSLDLRTIVRSGEEAIVVLNPIQIN